MSTSSRTRSTSNIISPVVIALGSNLGDRLYNLRRAVDALHRLVRIVSVSTVHETAAVDSPPGAPPFLNMVVVGWTKLDGPGLLDAMLEIERDLGRVRRGVRNEPRVIDLDLIVHGATRMRSAKVTLPHPRAHERPFVMEPLAECSPAAVAFLKRRYDCAPGKQR